MQAKPSLNFHTFKSAYIIKDAAQHLFEQALDQTGHIRPEFIGTVKEFIAAGRRAGRFIERSSQRTSVEQILKHWADLLVQAQSGRPAVALDRFDPSGPARRL